MMLSLKRSPAGVKKPVRPGFAREMLVLFHAIRHRETPVLPRLVAGFSLLYLISPVDLIPDVIPFAGWLDDLVVVPLLLHLAYGLLPARVVAESQMRAAVQRRRTVRILVLTGLVLLAAMAGAFWWWHTRKAGYP